MEIFFSLCLVLVGEKTNWPCTCSVSLAGVVTLSKVSSLKLFPCCRLQGAAERRAATFRLSPREIHDYRLLLSGLDMGHSVVRGGKE